jgi:hypothetical protein
MLVILPVIGRPSWRARFTFVSVLVVAAVTHAGEPDARRVAAWGPLEPNHPCDPNYAYTFEIAKPVWEPHIACGHERVIAVFNVGWSDHNKVAIGFAIGEPNDPDNWSEPNAWSWSEGQIPWYDPNEPNAIQFTRVIDPSIAYDSNTGDFLVAGLLSAATDHHIGVARFTESAGFAPWKSVQQRGAAGDDPNFPHSFDKPWLVAGEQYVCAEDTNREYYLVWWNWNPGQGVPGSYSYRRSIDGGETWHGSEIKVDDKPVYGRFCAQPAVHDSGALCIAYKPDADTIRFLEGTDSGDCNEPGVTFEHFYEHFDPIIPMGMGFEPALVEISLVDGSVEEELPGSFRIGGASTIGQLTADPGDPNRFYVAYHDVRVVDPNNVNVYLRKLTRRSQGWSLSQKYRVNRDGPNSNADQFLPALAVDGEGRVHVTFYDDRDYRDGGAQDEDQTDGTSQPKFDVYYTIITFDQSGNPSFSECELEASDPNEPALDFTLEAFPPTGLYRPGEYMGITLRAVQGARRRSGAPSPAHHHRMVPTTKP